MAITDEKLAVLESAFEGLPLQAQAILRDESASEILRAIGQIIGDKRSSGLKQAVAAAVTGDATINWTALDAARAISTADPQASRLAYKDMKTALDNHNATGLTAKALTFCITAISQYGGA